MKLVVLLQSFSPFSLRSFHLVNFKFHPFASTFSSPFKSLHCRRTPSVSMDPASVEGKRLSREKTIKNCFVEDDMDNEVDEEEEVGSDVYADDDKKKVSGRRGPGGISPPFCMVEKCGADLTDARRYHKRHKVCELHSKAPVVIVAGLKQRFCQQCSRFHELYEFDETKRSCRRRLAGHNERRRKNTAETTGEGPSRKGTQTKDSQCRQVDEKGRPQIPLQGNSTYKRPEIK